MHTVIPCTFIFIYLFGVLRRFQHYTGHITTGSWKGRGNQYIQFARVVYCKMLTNGKQLPAFPLKAVTGIEPRPQRWEARVLPLCHRGPQSLYSATCTEEGFLLKLWQVMSHLSRGRSLARYKAFSIEIYLLSASLGLVKVLSSCLWFT